MERDEPSLESYIRKDIDRGICFMKKEIDHKLMPKQLIVKLGIMLMCF